MLALHFCIVRPMRSYICLILCALIGLISSVETRAEFGEYRSIFVDRFDFPYSGGSIASHTATINQMMQNAAAQGFSDVVWQVRGRADALYNSNFEPPVSNLTPGFDPLQTAINAAHANGLKIHAWFNSTPMWNVTANPPANHILNNTNPSFRIRDINGTFEPQDGWSGLSYSSVNPILPEVHTHINNVVNDVATNYDVDGIHLDYIRYIPGGYDFDRFPHDSYSYQLFFDYSGGLDGSNPANEATYKEYIESRITDLVASVKQTVDAAELSTGRTMEYSASVWRDPDVGKNDFMQDYRTWMENDYLDVVMPMIYLDASNDDIFFNDNLLNTMSVSTNTRVVPTLASYLHDPNGGGVDLTLSQVERLNLMQADGVNFYDYPAYFNGYSSSDRTALKNYFDAQSDPNLGSFGTVLDDFETNEGSFSSSITAAGQTFGVLPGSSAARVTTEAQSGIASQQLDINGDPGGWLIRHLSGGANPANNDPLDATGYLGVWLKTDDPGITVQIALDDPDSADRGFKQPLIADGEWHLYQWNLEDDYQWEDWAFEEGIIIGPTVTIDSIFFEGAGDATIFIDTVSHNPSEILAEPLISAGPGDFDSDGDIDSDDLIQWEGDYGVNGDSDANDDGRSDGIDFLTWQRNQAGTQATAALTAVPEPNSMMLVMAIAVLAGQASRLRVA